MSDYTYIWECCACRLAIQVSAPAKQIRCPRCEVQALRALAERVVEAAVGLVAWCGQGAWEGEDGSPDALNKARAALAAWREGEP